MAKTERLSHLDALKGIAMLLVISGHTGWGDNLLSAYIYSFHMPLFFWIAGYFSVGEGDQSLLVFLGKKAKRLLGPYVVFFCIAAAYKFFLFPRLYHEQLAAIPVRKLIRAFLLSGGRLSIIPGFALWFLPCLLFTLTLFFFVRKLRSPYLIAAALVAVALITGPFQLMYPGRPPYHFNVIPAALVFVGAGYLWRPLEGKLQIGSLAYFLLLVVSIYLAGLNAGANIAHVTLPSYYYVSALCSIAIYYELAKRLSHVDLLTYVGRHSLFFFGLHEVVIHWIHHSGTFDWVASELRLPLAGTVAGHCVSLMLTVSVLLGLSITWDGLLRGVRARRARTSAPGFPARLAEPSGAQIPEVKRKSAAG